MVRYDLFEVVHLRTVVSAFDVGFSLMLNWKQ